MHEEVRNKLNTEITRKEFVKYLAGASLVVFGVDNLLSLVTGGRIGRPIVIVQGDSTSAFGTRKFGV